MGNQFTPESVVEVMSADKSREVVYSWGSWPVRLSLSGDVDAEKVRDVLEVIDEINSIVGGRAIALVEPEDKSEIIMVFSQNDHNAFEDKYSSFFIEEFGESEFRKWNKIGGFSFNFNERHPCFAFGLYHPADFKTEDYVQNNTPSQGFISIGNVKNMSNETYDTCIREEIAHMTFFIPDFEGERRIDSIFNSSRTRNFHSTFSDFDSKLMRLIFTSDIRHVNYKELRDIVRGYFSDRRHQERE